jgi:hypothetical protein
MKMAAFWDVALCRRLPDYAVYITEDGHLHLIVFGFSPLNPNGNYVPLASAVNNFAFCIYVSRMILNVNDDYFIKQR